MRRSAKLNVFPGARNLGEGMLPPHPAHLARCSHRSPTNWHFPFSATGGTIAPAVLALWAAGASDPETVTAATLLAALMVLAVVGHWFLILPLDGLWTWGRPASSPARAAQPARPASISLRP